MTEKPGPTFVNNNLNRGGLNQGAAGGGQPGLPRRFDGGAGQGFGGQRFFGGAFAGQSGADTGAGGQGGQGNRVLMRIFLMGMMAGAGQAQRAGAGAMAGRFGQGFGGGAGAGGAAGPMAGRFGGAAGQAEGAGGFEAGAGAAQAAPSPTTQQRTTFSPSARFNNGAERETKDS